MLSGPEHVYEFLKDAEHYDREVFFCLHLDARNRLLSCEEVSKGTLSGSLVHPREVYKAAILRSANAIIVAHNHPSGDPTPSEDDLEITSRLSKAGNILGIEVLDHIIVGDGCYYSLREEGELGS